MPPQKTKLHGTSGFAFKKMPNSAMRGIVGHSTHSLPVTIAHGLFSIIPTPAYFLYVIVIVGLSYSVYAAYPSVIDSVPALGGVPLFIVGGLGICLGKLYTGKNSRPTYIIGDKTK